MKLSGKQVTAARNLLGITQGELASATGLALETISRFERGEVEPRRESVVKIEAELERRGIEFTNGGRPPSNSDGMGVRINFDKAADYARTTTQAREEADR